MKITVDQCYRAHRCSSSSKKNTIDKKIDFVKGFGDDAGAIKLNGSGVPVTTVLVPARSTHAHNGIIDRGDFDRTVDLIFALIQSLDAAAVAGIKSFKP